MRILMLTPAFHPLAGGVERHVRRVSEELAARGHSVSVLTRALPEAPPREQLGPVEVYRVAGDARASLALLRRHRDLFRQADVIHCHDAYPFAYWYAPLRLALRLPRAFITFHGYEAYPPPREALRLRRWVSRAAAGRLCAGGFIPKWYATPCEAITYGGVDAPAGELPAPQTRAVFVGRLEPDTGARDYFEMLARLRAAHGVALPLEVCGDGSLRPELEARARAEALPVRFHGRVPEPMRFLAGARLAFVSGYLAMWEALACGALVVALHDNPLKRDYLECFPPAEAGVVAVCASAAAGAAQVARLLADPAAMEARARAGRQLAAAQNWQRVAAQYLALWERAPAPTGME